jgi:tetratricopeptide (TPR) repeat protein
MTMSLIRYNPGFRGDEELIRTFVVRKQDLELILETLHERSGPSNGHLLVVGPRGIGKTTLVRRVAAEVRIDPTLQARWYPIVFSEESYDVGSAGEFWLAALFHLADQSQDVRWQHAYKDLKKERDEFRLRERVLAQLLDFADAQGKRLLLIVENLNMILGDQLSDQDAWDLRHTLQNEPRLMLLGTATMRFEEIDNVDQAWFELLTIFDLKPLDKNECQTLWQHFTGNELVDARVRPIQILTGGNPRLISILADFAIKTSFRELMDNLIQLVDDHTEYFKSQLDGLAPTERKVFVALLDLWDPVSAKQISESARLEVSKTSSLLGRLVSRGAVTTLEHNSKRLYQATERLYNIYYLMRRRGHPTDRVHAVVTFMVQFYEGDQLVSTTARLAEEACKLKPEQRIDHFYAYEDIINLTPEQDRAKIVKATPSEFFKKPDAPSHLRKYADIHNGDDQLALDPIKEPTDAAAWVKQGRYLLSKAKQYTDAENAFRKAINLDPNLATAWHYLGRVNEKLKRYDEAEQSYKRAVDIKPDFSSAWEDLGDLLHVNLKRHAEAEQAFRKVVEFKPDAAFSWGILGHIYSSHLENYAEAEKAFRKAVELNFQEAWMWAQFGKILHVHCHKYDEAEQVLRKALEIDPEDSWAWAELGQLLYGHSNKFEEGLVALSKAVELNPNDTWAWINLAQVYVLMERYEDAERALRKAVELEPDSRDAWVDLAHILHENLGHLTEAEEAYKKIIKLSANPDWAWAHLGKLYQQQARYDEAEQALRTATSINQNAAWIWTQLGDLYEQLGKYEPASECYKTATEVEPSSDLAWLSLIKFELQGRGESARALHLAEQSLQINGRSAERLNGLAWAFYEVGSKELLPQAESWAREAVEKTPDDWAVVHTLSSILGAQGKWNNALELAPIFINTVITNEDAIRHTTDFLVNAASAGFAKEALAALESSKSATVLEPLVVGLRIVLGEIQYTAKEIYEVGKDVAKRIHDLEQQLLRKDVPNIEA